MDIILDKKNPTEASIKIKLIESDFQPKVEEKVKEYSRKAQIKGFRPGKVPTGIIKKMFGKSIIVEEINQLVAHSVTDYIKNNEIQILGEPVPNEDILRNIDWENQKEFEFEYNIGMVEEFQYDLSKLDLVSYTVAIDDKSLEEMTDNLKKQYGKAIDPEAVEKGDFIYGEVKQVEGEIFNNAVIFSDQIEAEELNNFIGAKINDSIRFDIRKTFKENDRIARIIGKSEEEAADINGEFELVVQSIKRHEPAALDQEFFDKIFGKDIVKTEEEFIEKLKNTLSESYQRDSDYLLSKAIQKQLVANTKISLPDDFLKRWLLAANSGKLKPEDIEKDYNAYVDELKWNLIKNKILKDHAIKIEHEEVFERTKDFVRKQFAAYGAGGEEIEANINVYAENYLRGKDGDNYLAIQNQIRTEKIQDLVKEKSTIATKNITAEEFKNIDAN